MMGDLRNQVVSDGDGGTMLAAIFELPSGASLIVDEELLKVPGAAEAYLLNGVGEQREANGKPA